MMRAMLVGARWTVNSLKARSASAGNQPLRRARKRDVHSIHLEEAASRLLHEFCNWPLVGFT